MYIFAADAAPNGWAFCLYLKYTGGAYVLSTCVSDDTNTWYDGSAVTISNTWQAIEMEWQTASAPGANNGYLKLWVNDVLVDTLSNLDTDTLGITNVTLGAVSAVSANISGSLYFDDFESRTGNHIGLLAYNAPQIELAKSIPQTQFQPVSYQQPSNIFAPIFPNAAFPNPALQQSTTQTINYVYDPLQRLKQANYSNGDYYHYTYDAVGNRLTQNKSIIGLVTTDTSVYDNANRMQSVNGLNYNWDNNGNLRNDGVNDYVYDSANRLKTLTNLATTVTTSYSYNGLGDRLSQTVNGQPTNYTLDLNTGLTQVLNDGTNTYLYGIGRIAQVNTTTEYFLGDALGSVRQLANASGVITYTKAYDPYGMVTSTNGASQSAYGFTGEQQDASGLTYLRARYYAGSTGRFLTRDTWGGNANSPMSFNAWNYTSSNPINYSDPSGHCVNPDGSVTWWKWPWFRLGDCPIIASGPNITLTPTATAIFTATVCTATPNSTMIPTMTPMPINTPINTPTPLVSTPTGDKFEKVYKALMDPQYQNKWWRKMDDGPEMVLAVLSYLELRFVRSDSGFINAATEVLAQRYWYDCPTGCAIVNGVPDGGMKWVMKFSWSLMRIANGVSADLAGNTIDSSFAKIMAEDVVRHPITHDPSRPWDWFNTQSDQEFRYFNSKRSSQGDTDPNSVYWMTPGDAKKSPVGIILTEYQYNTLCPSVINNEIPSSYCGH